MQGHNNKMLMYPKHSFLIYCSNLSVDTFLFIYFLSWVSSKCDVNYSFSGFWLFIRNQGSKKVNNEALKGTKT